MRIAEQHIKSGYFWLPSQPENKIPGTLKIYDGGKIELEIIGNFNNDLASISDTPTLQRIVGHIEKIITLLLTTAFIERKIFHLEAFQNLYCISVRFYLALIMKRMKS